ncbi:MAG: immunoglobulin domain-containing protein [Candidatus Auribacterota bacterium]
MRRLLLCMSIFLLFTVDIYALDNGYEFTSEFQINQYTNISGSFCAVSSNDTTCLVIWERRGSSTTSSDLEGRFINPDGSFASDELLLATYSSEMFAVTSDSTNFFIATTLVDTNWNRDITGLIISNDGTPITAPFPVNIVTPDLQRQASLASNASNYFAVWNSTDPDVYDYDIYGQFIDLSGNKIGQELTINTYLDGNQEDVWVCSNGDTYFVTWWSKAWETSIPGEVVGRIYSSSGQPLGDPFTIKQSPEGQCDIKVVSNGDSYLVAWSEPISDIRYNIMIRKYDGSGNPMGSESSIATATRFSIGLAGNANGFVVSWYEGSPFDGPVFVYAQKLDVNGFKVGSHFSAPGVRVDSFNSNNDQFLFVTGGGSRDGKYGIFLNPMASDVVISQQPQAVTGYVGESVTVSVIASSPNGALTYQWYKNGEEIGTSSSSVTISDLDNDDNGALIYCDISDSSGFVRSSAAKLTVLQPAFTISIAGNSILFGGNTAQYTATALYGDGSSYNVSNYVTWSITPGTLGEIDASGRLTVDPVSSFQQVLVQASLYDGYYDETHTGQKTVDINIPFNVTSMSVTPGSVETSAPLEIDIVCSDAVDVSLVNSSTCALIKAGHDGEFGTGDDSVLPVSAGLLTPAVIRLDLSSLTLPNDDYMVFVSGIKNTHGASLDGEYLDVFPSGDNHPGGNFAAEFTISRSVTSDIIFNDNDTVTLSWEPFRDGTVYRVDVTDDGTTWAPVDPVEQWPITATTWTGGAWKGYAMRLFRVVGVAPYISMIDPDYGMQDTFSMFVDITGYGISFPENETQVSFGDGILVVSVVADGSAHISVEIRISATAEPGMRDVVVTTPEKTYIKPAGFEVR